MRFARELFTGEIAGKSRDNTIRRLSRGEYREGYFLIALSESEGDLLEILPEETFLDATYVKYHDPAKLKVVGLAVTEAEARELMQKIVMYIYKKTGGFDLKAFFHFAPLHM